MSISFIGFFQTCRYFLLLYLWQALVHESILFDFPTFPLPPRKNPCRVDFFFSLR